MFVDGDARREFARWTRNTYGGRSYSRADVIVRHVNISCGFNGEIARFHWCVFPYCNLNNRTVVTRMCLSFLLRFSIVIHWIIWTYGEKKNNSLQSTLWTVWHNVFFIIATDIIMCSIVVDPMHRQRLSDNVDIF